MALLTLTNVSKNFGGLQVVSRASLEVAEGSLTGLVGPNGSGKSTLFHLIFGLVRPDRGSIVFRGRPLQGLAPHAVYGQGLAFAFQLPRLFLRLSVLDNLLFTARHQTGETMARALCLRRRWQRQEEMLAEKAFEVMELLGLTRMALEPAAKLSGGQRKLLEIGRALMADPVLMLLDEPAAGVNPVLARQIYETLDRLRHRGLTLFVIEHRLEVLFDFADRIYLMDAGRIVLSGRPQEVLADPVFYDTYVGAVTVNDTA